MLYFFSSNINQATVPNQLVVNKFAFHEINQPWSKAQSTGRNTNLVGHSLSGGTLTLPDQERLLCELYKGDCQASAVIHYKHLGQIDLKHSLGEIFHSIPYNYIHRKSVCTRLILS